jgi:hypothetical protein
MSAGQHLRRSLPDRGSHPCSTSRKTLCTERESSCLRFSRTESESTKCLVFISATPDTPEEIRLGYGRIFQETLDAALFLYALPRVAVPRNKQGDARSENRREYRINDRRAVQCGHGQTESLQAEIMHRPNPYSYSGCATAKPCEPTLTLHGLHSFDHCKGCVHGDSHYEGRQYGQAIIEINQWNSHISLNHRKGIYSQ